MRTEVEALGIEPGTREAQDLCLEYVGQDARLTVDVYAAILESGTLPWTSRSGRPNVWRPAFKDGERTRMLTVNEALKTPKPDTSWMSNPKTRQSCFAWTEELL